MNPGPSRCRDCRAPVIGVRKIRTDRRAVLALDTSVVPDGRYIVSPDYVLIITTPGAGTHHAHTCPTTTPTPKENTP